LLFAFGEFAFFVAFAEELGAGGQACPGEQGGYVVGLAVVDVE
jgi:hypothetical protein